MLDGMQIRLHLFSELVTYKSKCQDKNDSFNQIDASDINSFPECRERCHTSPKCIAFAYESNNPGRYNCNRYKGGPYTSGSDASHKTCYILKPGAFL